MNPIVAIVGRPNVGKSALFNRLVRERLAVVEDFPGVTRDRLYADARMGDRMCVLVDTGGFDPTEKQGLMPQVVAQARFAVEEAQAIVFVIDATEELTSLDFAVAEELRKSSKPIVVAANKADNEERAQQSFHALGLSPIIPVSALHGRNVEELADAVAKRLPPGEDSPEVEGEVIRIAIVGRPNVGKSSLTNAILGQERSIVSEIPGTTRDAVDTECVWEGTHVLLIDTAGLRRKARVTKAMEYHSVLRSLRAIERADVVFLVVEYTGITEQDARIGGYAHEAGKAIVITVNKWDKITDLITTVAPGERRRNLKTVKDDFARSIHSHLAFMEYAPAHYVSALRGDGVTELMAEALRLARIRQVRLPTAQLNAIVRRAVIEHPPPTYKGRQLKIRYATQVATTPPTIVLFVNDTGLVHFSYRRYLDNQIRKAFDFAGTPLRLFVRAGRE